MRRIIELQIVLFLSGCQDLYKDREYKITNTIYAYHQNGNSGFYLVRAFGDNNDYIPILNDRIDSVFTKRDTVYAITKKKEDKKFFRVFPDLSIQELSDSVSFRLISSNAELVFPK